VVGSKGRKIPVTPSTTEIQPEVINTHFINVFL
jgi:hypothetical protein